MRGKHPVRLAVVMQLQGSADRGIVVDYQYRTHTSDNPVILLISIIVIVATPIITWFIGAPWWAIGSQVAVLACSATFIVTRPLPPHERAEPVNVELD